MVDSVTVVNDGDLNLILQNDGEFGLMTRVKDHSQDELYGLWTDIVGLYANRSLVTSQASFTLNRDLDENGQVIGGARSVCEAFLPIDYHYTYIKSSHRIITIAYYDKNKDLISLDQSGICDNLTYGVQLNIPAGSKFMRFSTNMVLSNWSIQIIRVA